MPSKSMRREPLLTEEEKREVIAQVAQECGYVIRGDDPIFALVLLHDRVLSRSVERLTQAVRQHLVSELECALQQHVNDMGTQLAKRAHEELRSLSEVFDEVEERVDARGRRWLWGIVSIGSVLIILFGLILLASGP